MSTNDTYKNGPEGMPRLEKLSDSTIDWALSHIARDCTPTEYDRKCAHAIAEEVLARLPAWPAAPAPAASAATAVQMPKPGYFRDGAHLPNLYSEGQMQAYGDARAEEARREADEAARKKLEIFLYGRELNIPSTWKGLLDNLNEQLELAAKWIMANQRTAGGEAVDLLPPMGIRNDRDMLNYLMQAFDSEMSVCNRCGDEHSTSTCDSAHFLRDYLKAAAQPVAAAAAQAGGDAGLLQALRDITDPIGAMQREVPEGYKLDGHAALAAADKPQWYKNRAERALAAYAAQPVAEAAAQPSQAPVREDWELSILRNFADEVKELCRDYSSRTGSVYVGDVQASIDGLYQCYVNDAALTQREQVAEAAAQACPDPKACDAQGCVNPCGQCEEAAAQADDVAVLRKWAEQVGRLASSFNDERSLLCQQAAVLLHRIAHQPAAPAAQPATSKLAEIRQIAEDAQKFGSIEGYMERQAAAQPALTDDEPAIPLRDETLLAKLRACVDDPMMADYSEVSKNTLRAVIKCIKAKIEADRAALAAKQAGEGVQ